MAPTDEQREQAIEQAKKDDKVQAFERHLNHKIELLDTEIGRFNNSIATNGLLYALEWSASGAANSQVQADLWREVQYLYTDEELETHGDPVKSLRPIRRRVERQLLKNWVRQSSTNEMANALSGVKADAFARFYDDATGMLEFLLED